MYSVQERFDMSDLTPEAATMKKNMNHFKIYSVQDLTHVNKYVDD